MRIVPWCVVLLAACAEPQPTSEESNAAARAVLDRLIATIGGDSVLAGVQTLVAQYEFRATDPAADPEATIEVLQARDFVTGRNLYEVHTRQAPETWERIVMSPGRAFTVDMLTGEQREYDTPAAAVADYSELQLRWYVYLPIGQARSARTTLRHRGDTTFADRDHDIVSFLDAQTGEIRLYIDRNESRLRRMSWMTSGVVPRSASLTYTDYDDASGLPMPMAIAVGADGQQTARYDMLKIQVNVRLQESAFEPPPP